MDPSTLTLLLGVISSIIGIVTFIMGMNSKAQRNGILEQKINQAIDGIEEIKSELRTTSSSQNSLALLVRSHEEKIKTLFRQMETTETHYSSLDQHVLGLDQIGQSLVKILEYLERKGE